MIQLRNQGIVLGEDSEKMSKSRGNVVAPDELVQRYGADAVRAYLMFFARWEMGAPWSSSGIDGVVRWLRRVWSVILEPTEENQNVDQAVVKSLRRKVHQTLKSVTYDYENFEFNTIISKLMELMNEMSRVKPDVSSSPAWNEAVDIYLKMLAPVAPHIAEELWHQIGKTGSIHTQNWPEVDEDAARQEEITLVLQVNGKVRDRMVVPVDISDEAVKQAAMENPNVQKFMEGKPARKVIYVKGKLVNIVI